MTPSATASAVAAIAVAERKLLASFISWPRPGRPPTWNTRPNTSSSGRTRSSSGAGPATMTASVPGDAPRTPPETGASRVAMPRPASAAATSAATACPVVEKIDVDPDRAAVDQAVRPERDRAHHLRRRQADEHDLGPIRDLGRRAGRLDAFSGQRVHRLRAQVVHDQPVPGREQPPAHRPAHLAQPDEADRCGHFLLDAREHGRFTAASPR